MGSSLLRCLAGTGLLFFAAGASAATGVIQTREARLDGDIALQSSTVQVGTNVVPWSSVLYVLLDSDVRTFPPSQRVQWFDGEEWRGEVMALSAGKLTFRFDLFGVREVASTNVSLLDFSPNDPQHTSNQAGTIYLRDGEPLSGTLVWIDAQQLAVDSPLGVLTLPRERVLRYVFPAGERHPSRGRPGDEVRLVDGTMLQGFIRIETNQVTVRHRSLGEFVIPAEVIRSIVRNAPDVDRLTDLPPASATSEGLFSPAPAEGRIVFQRHDDPGTIRPGFLTSMIIPPKTTLTYRLGDDLIAGATFRARWGAAPEARGSARITLLAGTNLLFEREFKGGEAPVPVTVPVPAARELIFQVDYGSRIGFPCGVCLADAFLMANPDKTSP